MSVDVSQLVDATSTGMPDYCHGTYVLNGGFLPNMHTVVDQTYATHGLQQLYMRDGYHYVITFSCARMMIVPCSGSHAMQSCHAMQHTCST